VDKIKWGDFFSKDALALVSMKRLFLLGNMGLFVIVAIFIMHPAFASWRDSQEQLARQQETRDRLLQEMLWYEGLLEEVMESPFAKVVPYENIAATMDAINNLALGHDMEVTQFIVAEPIILDSIFEEEYLVEIRVAATFVGTGGYGFIRELNEIPVFARTVRVVFLDEGGSDLVLELSLFGRRSPH